jgi:hypothetical protein
LPNTILEYRPIIVEYKIINFENYSISGEISGGKTPQNVMLPPFPSTPTYGAVKAVAPLANARTPITLLFFDNCAPQYEFGRVNIPSKSGYAAVAARYYVGFRAFQTGNQPEYFAPPIPMGYSLYAKSIGDNAKEISNGTFLGSYIIT